MHCLRNVLLYAILIPMPVSLLPLRPAPKSVEPTLTLPAPLSCSLVANVSPGTISDCMRPESMMRLYHDDTDS